MALKRTVSWHRMATGQHSSNYISSVIVKQLHQLNQWQLRLHHRVRGCGLEIPSGRRCDKQRTAQDSTGRHRTAQDSTGRHRTAQDTLGAQVLDAPTAHPGLYLPAKLLLLLLFLILVEEIPFLVPRNVLLLRACGNDTVCLWLECWSLGVV